MSYWIWKKATGKKQKIDRGYAKLNKMRKDWKRRELEVYGHVAKRPKIKKYKKKPY